MYWTCTAGTSSYIIPAVSERTPPGAVGGARGDALFFRILFRQTHFFSLSFLSEESQRPVHLWKYHGHEISFRDMGSMEGEGVGSMYCIVHVIYTLEYKITILLVDDLFAFFFEPIKLSDDKRMPRQKKHIVLYISRNIHEGTSPQADLGKTYYTNYFSAACTSP